MTRIQVLGLALFIAGLFILALSSATLLVGGDDGKGLPDYGLAPAWSLTDRQGETVTSDDLAGTPYVTLFYFLQCRGVCPAMLASMKQLDASIAQGALNGQARIIGMSIDGENDTPEAIAQYHETMSLTDGVTQLLTAPQDTVWPIAQQGFKLLVEKNTDPNVTAGLEINHAGRFVLVDKQGRIRGYYDNEDPQQLQDLLNHLTAMARK